LVVHQYRGGKHWIATDQSKLERKGVPESAVLRVQTVTLDYLVEGGVIDPERTGLLWMDAEAHEGHVLEGASSLVARGTPLVLEFNPARLEFAGGRDKVQDAIADNYTHFASMHRNPDSEKAGYALHAVDELLTYAESFLGQSRRSTETDILVLRLEREQAEGIEDLEPVFRRARTTADDGNPESGRGEAR
jgi:hypothetical protein